MFSLQTIERPQATVVRRARAVLPRNCEGLKKEKKEEEKKKRGSCFAMLVSSDDSWRVPATAREGREERKGEGEKEKILQHRPLVSLGCLFASRPWTSDLWFVRRSGLRSFFVVAHAKELP